MAEVYVPFELVKFDLDLNVGQFAGGFRGSSNQLTSLVKLIVCYQPSWTFW